MYRPKFKFAMAILLAILGFATVQMKAELPIVQADTVFAGFGGGSVSGIVFGPDGNTVILMHNATPTEIDIKTHKVLREFEAVPNATGEEPHLFFNKQKNYIGGTFYSTKYSDGNIFSGEIIWDYSTGKIIKAIPDILLLTDGNMERYYTYFNHNFCSFDINTFNIVDSISLPKDLEGFGYVAWGTIGIIPNSNKVLINAGRYSIKENGDREYSLSELYVMDFDTKKFTKIPIPYESWQESSQTYSINVTETGKYNIINISKTFYIFDKDFNFLYKLGRIDLQDMTNISYIDSPTLIMTVTDDYMIIYVTSDDYKIRKMIFFSIPNKTIVKYLGFTGDGVFDKTSQQIALYGTITGLTGVYSLESLPVKENRSLIDSKDTINYQDSRLIINTTTVGNVEINITDYNGNLLQSQKDVFLHNGSNTIKLKTSLGNGVYFCIIKSSMGNNSFKFMVNK